jgi:esterase
MELFFQRYGEGPPLVVLHGLYGSSDNWVSIAKKLADRFEVWLPDLRNHGRSPHAPEHNYKLMCEDIENFFVRNGLKKAILLGHSMGGKTAMFFASMNPEKVTALIVVDIAPKSYLLHNDPTLGTTDHANILAGLLGVNISDTKSRDEVEQRLSAFIHSPKVIGFLMKNLYRNTDHHFAWRLNIEAIYNNLDAILDGMQLKDFERGKGITGFPVLFIRGGNSTYIRNEDIPAIRTIFPYAEVVTIPGAGHWVHAEKPEILLKNIEYFIET